MSKGTKLLIAALLALGVGSLLIPDQTVTNIEAAPTRAATTDEADMIALNNNYRLKAGLAALEVNPRLMDSAQEKADTLCKADAWTHEPGGEAFFEPIKRSGYAYVRAGENLAKDFKSTGDAFQGLLRSPAHHRAIVGDYSEIGVGFNKCGSENLFVIHYGSPS